MKIVATLTDVNAVVHAGGDVERRSTVIEIPNDLLIAEYLHEKWKEGETEHYHSYLQLSFSILDESIAEGEAPCQK